jgi:hypothetical protein
VLTVFTLTLAAEAAPQGVVWRPLRPSDILSEAVEIHPYTRIGLAPNTQDVIENERLFEDTVLVADRIVFRPGSRLVFGANAKGDRTARYIVARTIVIQPGLPSTITWFRGGELPQPPGFTMSAAAGSIGAVDGAPGNPGANGAVGNPGYPGRNAPALYVFASRIEGGPIRVDLSGQDGGPGGVGQEGGHGGLGRSGRRAVASLIDCRSPGGDGGRGGAAGNGGQGGPGGRGGSGGIFIVVTTARSAAAARQAFKVDVAPGAGGPGGPGGKPGLPGIGGIGGFAVQRCEGGKAGEGGAAGQPGEKGVGGSPGAAGELALVEMSDEQFARAVSP